MNFNFNDHFFKYFAKSYLSNFKDASTLQFLPIATYNPFIGQYDTSVIMSVGPNAAFDELLETCTFLNDQLYSRFILLIFFDGAEYSDFIDSLSKFNYPIRVFASSSCLGLGIALNFLCRESLALGCEFIVRSDADDYSAPSRIGTLVENLKSHNEIDFVGSSYQIVSDIPSLHNKVRVFPKTSHEAWHKSALTPIVAHATVAFRASLFHDKITYLDDFKIGIEDQLLWLQARLMGLKFINLDCPIYYVRINKSFLRRRLNFKKTLNLFAIRLLHSLHPASSFLFSILGVLLSSFRLLISILFIPLSRH